MMGTPPARLERSTHDDTRRTAPSETATAEPPLLLGPVTGWPRWRCSSSSSRPTRPSSRRSSPMTPSASASRLDEYDMIWVTVAYGVGVIYGVFAGLSLSVRIGKRYTLVLAMLVFSVGNILCGAATGLVALAFARFVEGFGKMLAMAVCRVTLYKQFDRALLVAIGFYGVFAYSTRHVHTARQCLPRRVSVVEMDVLGLRAGRVDRGDPGLALRPSRPAAESNARADRLAGHHRVRGLDRGDRVCLLLVPQVGRLVLERVRRHGRPCVVLPVALVAWLGSGLSPDEHLNRILRSRVYVLCLTTRGLMLLHMVAVLTIVGMYCTELRGYPRITSGWLMVPTSADDGGDHLPHDLVSSPIATARLAGRGVRGYGGLRVVAVVDRQFHRQGAPGGHAGLLGSVPGTDPPGLPHRRDRGAGPEGHALRVALGLVGSGRPIYHGPERDRDDGESLVRPGRRRLSSQPSREPTGGRAGFGPSRGPFPQRGLSGSGLQQETSRVLGGFVTLESVAHGFRSGLRFLSLMMFTIGLMVAVSLARAARGCGAARVGLHLMNPRSRGHIGTCIIGAVAATLIVATSAWAQARRGSNHRASAGPPPSKLDADVAGLFRYEPTGLSLLRPYGAARSPWS